MNKRLPIICPSCDNQLKVKQLICTHCETELTGLFSLPSVSRFTTDEQNFILDFVRASGSLKLMAQNMKLSYPTVRNRLDEIIAKINKTSTNED